MNRQRMHGRKIRWADKRQIPEEGLERFEDYLQTCSRNKNHPFFMQLFIRDINGR